MEIEIIHREYIKPASPTPDHLRTYNVSLLDQLLPLGHHSLIFFYPSSPESTHFNIITERTRKLKESLSATLVDFYPFAGKIGEDHLTVYCNDEGVYYAEARVRNCHLTRFLHKPDKFQELHQFVHHEPETSETKVGICVLMVQENIFDCGGMALCVSSSHKVTDGSTMCSFLKAWAANASSSPNVRIFPSFIAPSLFPQSPSLPEDSTMFLWPNVFKQGKSVSRGFVFNDSAIRKLKAEATTTVFKQIPTTVDFVSAIIWKCIINASRKRNHSGRSSLLSLPVDLRKRKSPPWPEHSFGNLLWNAAAECKAGSETELHCLVGHLIEAKQQINSRFVEQIEGNEGLSIVREELRKLSEVYSDGNCEYISVISHLNSGIYEVDFGWGKPTWLSPGGSDPNAPVFLSIIVIMERRAGYGIEAWVTLDEQDMEAVESDPELLAVASLELSGKQTNTSQAYTP